MATLSLPFAGGTSYTPPSGESDNFYFRGTWAAGDEWTVSMSTTSGDFTLGVGNIAGVTLSCIATLSDRVYLGGANQITFSALSDPTGWEQQDVGAGFISLMSQYGQQDSVTALTSYQGKLAVYGRRSVQIWTLNADPLQFSRSQTLPNTGTMAALSVQSLGDQDVLALSDYGVWSMRVRDASNNAYTVDMGSAIQLLLQDKLLQCNADDVTAGNPVGTTAAKACAVVDPSSNRYWLWLRDQIYVLSYFSPLGILAWTTYKATDNAGVAFTPLKFVVYQGQIFCRGHYADGTEALITYGGNDNNTYDTTKAVVEMPWLANKEPATNKQAKAVDVIRDGKWKILATMDYLAPITKFATIDNDNKPTPQSPTSPYTATGTHFKLRAETTDVAHPTSDGRSHPPTISSFIFHYEMAGKR